MGSFSVSTPLLVLLLCLLRLGSASASSATASSSSSASRYDPPLVFPLRYQKTPSLSIPRRSSSSWASKLTFRHNVTLTVTLSVGTPPQNVSMVLDTGSELSWLQCTDKPGGGGPPSFRPRSSATYSPEPCSSATCRRQTRDLPSPATCDGSSCHVSVSYADASTSEGVLASDRFAIAGPPSVFVFGCMASAYSAAAGDPGAAGLLGMNRGALSFVTQTATARFAYCISDRDASGVLLLGGGGGGPSSAGILPSLNYTPLIQMSLPLPYFDRVAYSVQLEGIRVGATLLPIPKSVLVPDHTGAGQTMVDSGSQFTFLLGPAYDALKAEFLRQTRRLLPVLDEPDFVFQGAFDTCFRLPAGRAPPAGRLPEVGLMMRGAEVAVTGERLLYRAPGETRPRGGGGDEDGVWCLTFGNSDLVPMEAYVIGHHHQQNVWVEYDLHNSRVGFAPVRCDLAGQRLGLGP